MINSDAAKIIIHESIIFVDLWQRLEMTDAHLLSLVLKTEFEKME